MKKQLTRIVVFKTGIFLATLFGVLSLIFVIPFVLLSASLGVLIVHSFPHASGTCFSPSLFGAALGGASALVGSITIPIFCALVGFISGIIVAAVYNLIAKLTGGLEFEVRDFPPPLQ